MASLKGGRGTGFNGRGLLPMMSGKMADRSSHGDRMELTAQTPARKGLDRPAPYLATGGAVVLVAGGLAVSIALAIASRGAEWRGSVALALLLIPVAGFGVVGVDTVRHGLGLRGGSVEHRSKGVVRFGAHDWSRLFVYYLVLAVVLGLGVGLVAAGLGAVIGPLLALGGISGLVMTANLQSDYLQDVRGVPPRPAGLLAWALAIVGCIGLFVGVANALRLSEKYDL